MGFWISGCHMRTWLPGAVKSRFGQGLWSIMEDDGAWRVFTRGLKCAIRMIIPSFQTRFCRDDKREVFLKRLYISDPDLLGVCPTWPLLYGSNCAMQLRSDKAFPVTRTRDEFDYKRNNSRKAFAYAFWEWVLKHISTLGKDDKHSHRLQSLGLGLNSVLVLALFFLLLWYYLSYPLKKVKFINQMLLINQTCTSLNIFLFIWIVSCGHNVF